MPTPTYEVKIAWDNAVAGLFRIGASKVGGTDGIGGIFAYSEASFTDETAHVKQFEITRGRDDELGPMQGGRCTLTLKDTDGSYNPENASATLAGKLVPMRPVRIKVTHPTTAVTATRFYGFIYSIEHDPRPSVKETTISCVDLFEWLANYRPTIASMGATTVGAAIKAVLDDAGWSDTTMQDLDTGKALGTFSADGSTDALSLITDLVTADGGMFFIAGSGKATFISNSALWVRTAVVATFTEANMSGGRPGTTLSTIINRQSVTKTGSTEQTARDAASERQFGKRDGTAITSPYFQDDAQALSLATWRVGTRKDPTPPTKAVELTNDTDAKLTELLARELGDYVRVNDAASGTDLSGWIQRISLKTDMAGMVLTGQHTVQKKPKHGFTIGVSAVGSADVLVY